MFRSFRGWIGRASRPRARRPLAAYHRLGRVLEYLEDRTVPALIGYAGGDYTQNFDALPTATPSGALPGPGPYFLDADAPTTTNNVKLDYGIAGWQFFKTGSGVAALRANDGGLGTGSHYSYGTGTAADRAFGQLYSDSYLGGVLGATFTNTGSSTYTQFTLTFTAEHWRQGATLADTHAFSYAVGATTTNINTGSYTNIAAGDLVSVGTDAGPALDGNAAANRQGKTVTVTGISWAPGQNLTIRWTDSNSTGGSDDGLAVDDLTFTAATGGAQLAPTVTSRNNTVITEGVSAQTFVVTAGGNPAPTSYAITTAGGQTGPPDGTTIDAAGLISFPTPAAPANNQTQAFTFTVSATNTVGTGTQAFTLYVVPAAKPAVPLTPGNLLVYRLGDGGQTYGSQGSHPTPTVGSSGHAVFLDEYTPAGAFVQTVFVPTTGADRMAASLSATSEGMLTVSADGRVAAFTGYRADIGTANVAGTASGTTPRVARTVLPDGTLGASAVSSTAFDGNNVRGVGTVDGRQFYLTGNGSATTGGVRYFDTPGAADAPGVRVTNTSNVRGVSVVGGQVYFSTGSGPGTPAFNAGRGVYTPNGLPLPTTAPADAADAGLQATAGGSSSSPFQYAVLDMNGSRLLDDGDRLYFTDDRAAADGGGVYRADYAGSAFGTPVQVLAAAVPDLRGLTGVVDTATTATLYVTAATNVFAAGTTFSTALYTLTDANATPAAAAAAVPLTTLVSRADGGNTAAAPVQQFRGVAVVPRRAGLTGDVATVVNVTASPASVPVGGTTTITAAVVPGTGTSSPDGYVTFYDPATGRALQTSKLDAAGQATYTVAPPGGGSYSVDVFYGGTDTYLAATGSVTVTLTGGVAPSITSAPTLVVNPGETGQFQVTATGHPAPTYSLSGNPSWVSINSTNGLLTYAVPGGQAVGEVPFTITATNGLTPATQTFTLMVQAPGGFTAGNIVVVRVGTGAAALTGNATATFLDEFTAAGVPTVTIPLPTVSTQLAVNAASQAGTVVTVTTAAPHGFLFGQPVTVAGMTPAGYNGTFTVTGVPSATEFTYVTTAGLAAATAFGTAAVVVNGLTVAGTAAAEGALLRSLDGQTLSLAGYRALPGGSVTSVNRQVAVVGANGGIDLSTQLPAADGFVRAAASADGRGFFLATSNGVRYVPFGNAATPGVLIDTATSSGPTATITTAAAHGLAVGQTVVVAGVGVSGYNGTFVVASAPSATAFTYVNTVNNLAASGGGSTIGVPSSVRLSNYYNSITTVSIAPPGQLYLTLGTGASAATGVPAIDGPAPVGVGLPTAGGQTAQPLFGFPTDRDAGSPASFPVPNQFVFSPDGNTVYLADGRTNGNGGLYKYEFSFGQWVETASHLFPIAGGVAGTGTGLRGLAVDFSAASPVVYATTAEASANRILRFTDSGFGFSAPTTLATAPANTAYRGVSLAPVAAGTTPTTTALAVAPAGAGYGAGVTLTATVTRGSGTATPTGVVSFRTAGGREIGAAVLTGTGASATATFTTAGNLGVFGSPHTITAVYTGSPTFAGSSSTSVSAAITPDATAVTLTVAPNPIGAGANTTITAVLGSIPAGTAPTGTVTFYDGAAVVGAVQPVAQVIVPDGSGNPVITFRASVTVSFDTTGTKSLTAVYSGETNFDGSTSPAVNLQVVAATTTTVGSSDAGTAPVGPTLTFTATVAPASGTGPTPTGTVQFFDNLLPLGGAVTLSGGVATRAVPTALLQAAGSLTPGLHSIRAVYTPDAASAGTYFASTGLRTQAVQVQAFGPGNPLVQRVGDGTAVINTTSGTPVYVDEYTAAGALVQSVAFPVFPDLTGGNTVHALVTQAQQSTTGALTLSGDGRSVFLAGYDSAPVTSGDVRSTAGVGRTVGRIAADGTVSTGVALSDAATGSANVNGVYSPDGNSFYITGSAGGVRYVPAYTPQAAQQTSTAVAASSNVLLDLVVAGGQLYVTSNNNATLKVGTVGAGTPTGGTNTITQIPGIPQGTTVVPKFPIGAYFTHLGGAGAPAGINTLYLAENGTGFAGGTLTKWALSDGASPTWSNVGTITADVTDVVSFYWLSGQTAGGTTTLYSTYGSGGGSSTGPGQLLRVTDANGWNQGFSSTTVTKVAETGGTSNLTFRGVARAPQDLTSSLTSSANPGPDGQPVTLTFAVTGGPDVPTGTVYFYDGTTPLGEAAVDAAGQATFVTAPLALGTTYNFSATYTGDSDHNPVTRTLTQTVTQGTTVQFTAAQFDAVADPQTLNLTVTRTGGTAAATIHAYTTAGTAADGVDFTAVPQATPFVVQFAENQTTAVVPVALLDGGATYAGARTFTVTLADSGGGAAPGTQATTTVSITDPVLQVVGTPAVAGSTVTLAFNRKVDPVPVNLYDTAAGTFGAADLQVVDGTTGAVIGAVRGSLVFDPTANAASFVNTAGSLPTSGTFKVRLASGATAFRGLDGRALDGDGDNSPGGDYLSATLTTAAGPTVGVRGFARAAGQPVNVPATGAGFPVTIRGAANVTQVGFTLTYDPTLLTIPATGALTLSAGAAGAGLALAAYTITAVDARHAVLTASASGGGGWNPADGAVLLTVAAEVPADAPYLAKHVLDVGGVTVNAAAGVGADGVHVAALVGEVSGDRAYTSLDSGLITQVGLGQASGFGAFNNLDPVLVGGVSGGSQVTSLDTGLVSRFGLGLPTPQVPAVPPGTPPAPNGPDPRYYIETVRAGRGQTVTVQVRVEVTEEAGIDLFALNTALRFDPAVLQVSNVRTAPDLLALQAGIGASDNTQNDLGQLRVLQSSTTGRGTALLPKGTDIAVVAFDVTVDPNAPFGLTRLNLVPRIENTPTELYNAASETLVLLPAPTDRDDDARVDGGVRVIPPVGAVFLPDTTASTGEMVTVPVLFRNGPVPVELFAFNLALTYDPAELQFVDAAGGAFVGPPAAFNFTFNPDPVGSLRVGSDSSNGLTRTINPGEVVELATLSFTVLSTGGSTFVNLVPQYGEGNPTPTALFQTDGAVDLDPPPTAVPGGDEDGLVTVVIRPNQPPTAAVRDTANFAPERVLFNPADATGLQTATPNVFAFTGGDLITVNDPDAGAADLTVTLTLTGDGSTSAPVGALAATAAGAATVTPSADGTVLTLVGTLADLNATLESLTYTPGPGYSGRTTVGVLVDDGGNTGFGGPLTATRSTAVDVVGLYISELMLGPGGTGTLAPTQYVEVYSTVPGYVIPSTVYLVGIEGDNNNPVAAENNPGLVQDIFRLGGQTTGTNGFLALLQRPSTGTNPYLNSGAVVGDAAFVNTGGTAATGIGFGNGLATSRFNNITDVHVGQQTGTGARNGAPANELRTDLERGSATYFLIQTGTAPAIGNDIDTAGGNDGTPDGAVYAGWNVLDGVGLHDLTNGSNPDRSYAPITFSPRPASGGGGSTGTARAGTTVVLTNAGGSPWVPTYTGRIGRNVGYSGADWLAAVAAGPAGNATLSPTLSTAFAGQALNHIAAPNFWATRASVLVNDGGSEQRSQVSHLTVVFSQPVDVADPAAFALVTAGGVVVPVDVLDAVGGSPVAAGATGVGSVVLVPTGGASTFAFAAADPFGLTRGLVDGNYWVRIDAAQVTTNGLALDGDGDGTAGGDLSTQVYRLYGDANGDRRVDGADNARFRAAYTGAPLDPADPFAFDANVDSVLDGIDLTAFRAARGGSLPPA